MDDNSSPPYTVSTERYDEPVTVECCLHGGVGYEISGVVSMKMDNEGLVVLEKSDGTKTFIAPGWLMLSEQT